MGDLNITAILYNNLKEKQQENKATQIEKKIFSLLDLDIGTIYIDKVRGIWYLNKNNSTDRIPQYFYNYLKKYILKLYNVYYWADITKRG